MRQDNSTRNRANENADTTPPSIAEELRAGHGDPLNVTKKARGLIDNNDPVALEIFHMGRRHGLEVQESRSRLAMTAFMEGMHPNYNRTVLYDSTQLANACRVWSDPVIRQSVQPSALQPPAPAGEGHPLDGKWIRDSAVMAWDALQPGEMVA